MLFADDTSFSIKQEVLYDLQTLKDDTYQIVDLRFRTNELKLINKKSKISFFTFKRLSQVDNTNIKV